MLDHRYLAQLSPLAQRFRAHFAKELGYVRHTEAFTTCYELVIPAAHPVVGELRVWDDGDELTIGLGEYHHWHVPLYVFMDSPEPQRADAAAIAAVREIREVLELRTVLRITRRGGKVRSSMTYNRERGASQPLTGEDSEYVWTGPYLRHQ